MTDYTEVADEHRQADRACGRDWVCACGSCNIERAAFRKMYKVMPASLMGATDHPETVSDLAFAAQHEIDLSEEGQDGALHPNSIRAARKFLNKCRTLER